jgi:AraC-like DNA-binding protein
MRAKNDLTQAIVLRESGYTLAAICERTGLSASTCYRAFKKLDVTRGALSKDTLKSAKQKLLEDSGLVGDLKQAIASQISDDLALARSIREGLVLAMENLINDAATPATLKARSYAALATSLKSTSDIMRRALQIDDGTMSTQEIPSLTIRKMTDDDIKAVQSLNNKDDDDMAA